MKKHTLGEHYDAWNRFIRWYWKYTIKPRFTNIPRRIRYHLFKRSKTKWDDKYVRPLFYDQGMIPDKTEGGYHTQSFKEWWKENVGFEAREGNQKKREELKKQVKAMRKIIKKL